MYMAYNCMQLVSDCLTDALYRDIVQNFIMTLGIFDAHIIHYNMNPLLLVALGHSYYAHPSYRIIWCWMWATLLHLTSVIPVGSTKCLEVCLGIQRDGRLHAKWCSLLLHHHHLASLQLISLLDENTNNPQMIILQPQLDLYFLPG